MKDEKQKMLTYRRANFLVAQPEGSTLQNYLFQAHSQFPNVDQRRVSIVGRPDLEGRNYQVKGPAFFLHIAAYTPGEEASVVPKLKGVPKGDVATTPPPKDCEFMDGDITALVSGNHVILCASNLHEKHAELYMSHIIEKAKINASADKFELSKVAEVSKIELIKKQGVKAINLDADLYNATLDYSERKTLTKQIGGEMGNILSAIFCKDKGKMDLEFAHNLSVKVILSYDQRKKDLGITGEQFQAIATDLVNGGEEGFSIITKGGETIRPNDIILKKKTTLPKHGKSVYCASSWDAMETYFLELREGGLLEQ